MCGRIGLPELSWRQYVAWLRGELDWDQIERDQAVPVLPGRYNVAPTSQVGILYADGPELVGTNARWWLVPAWHRGDPKDWKAATFNARIETAHEKPAFRQAWASTRCAIPVTGYFEWTGAAGAKQPWWITADTNAPALLLAGLHTQLPDGTRTCTILTRPALPQIAHIHDRTPVILSPDECTPWLSGDIDADAAAAYLGTSWDGRMITRRVAPFGIHDDGPQLLEPIDDLF